MGAIFQSLGRTVAAGVVLLIILILLVSTAKYDHAWGAFVMRWLHVMSGVMWIGLLWYFNFVQIPSMPKIPDEQKPAVGKVIAPTALFWFRWAALATVVTGALLAAMNSYIGQALMLQRPFKVTKVGPVDEQLTVGGSVVAQQQFQQRGFSRAAFADDRDF